MPNSKVECTISVLPVRDLERSIQFYTDTLGFKLDWRGEVTASVTRDGHPIMLSQGITSEPPGWVWIGLRDDLLFDSYRTKGVEVAQNPMNHTWAYEMKFKDIDGNILWLGTETRKELPLDD
jgi:predicted lactoylglutathione lyase